MKKTGGQSKKQRGILIKLKAAALQRKEHKETMTKEMKPEDLNRTKDHKPNHPALSHMVDYISSSKGVGFRRRKIHVQVSSDISGWG